MITGMDRPVATAAFLTAAPAGGRHYGSPRKVQEWPAEAAALPRTRAGQQFPCPVFLPRPGPMRCLRPAATGRKAPSRSRPACPAWRAAPRPPRGVPAAPDRCPGPPPCQFPGRSPESSAVTPAHHRPDGHLPAIPAAGQCRPQRRRAHRPAEACVAPMPDCRKVALVTAASLWRQAPPLLCVELLDWRAPLEPSVAPYRRHGSGEPPSVRRAAFAAAHRLRLRRR